LPAIFEELMVQSCYKDSIALYYLQLCGEDKILGGLVMALGWRIMGF
jgi:hypothetical protein